MDQLTEKQTEVANLVAGGWTNGYIAKVLGCQKDTVADHVSKVKKALGLTEVSRENLPAALRDLGYRRPQ